MNLKPVQTAEERMKWLKENEVIVAIAIALLSWVVAFAILFWSVDEVIDFFKE